METSAPPIAGRHLLAVAVGVLLVALTFSRYEFGPAGCSWAAAQLALVAIAAVDAATRRIPNRLVTPAAAIVVVLRASFAGGTLLEAVLAAVAVFAAFLLFAVATAGFGMGDVKLAALLGLLLGWQVLPALLVGAIAGGAGASVALGSGRASRRTTIPYGPYLCLGGALAILLFHPPALA